MADGGEGVGRDNNLDPHNLSAEMAVLGAIIYDNSWFTVAAERLHAEDFYSRAHRRVFEVCRDLILTGRTATGVGLREHFERDGQLKEFGGARFLAELVRDAAFGPEVKDFSDIIRECAIKRRIIAAGDTLISGILKTGTRDPDLLLAEARELLDNCATTIRPDTWRDSRFATIEALGQVYKGEQAGGIETGLEGLDRITGGLFRGDLTIIGGRPSMGKSALLDQIEANVASRKIAGRDPVVAKFSLEMDERQLAYRNASRAAHQVLGETIAYSALRRGRPGDREGKVLHQAMGMLPRVFWDTQARVDVHHIRTQLTRLKKAHGGIDLVTCDYLQIMDIIAERGETGAAAIGRTTKALKQIAKEFDVPIVVLSQLSRDVEKREDKRPMLSDLRDSGSIEADADMVMFCYREAYYLERAPVPKDADKKAQHEAAIDAASNMFEVIVAKQRMGALATAKLYWEPTTSFVAGNKHAITGGAPEQEGLF